MADTVEITDALRRLVEGDERALDDLLPRMYQELHDIAQRVMHNEPTGHTLQTTALVNEAYLRVFGLERIDWESRAHFVAVVARAMRRVLVDHARKKHRKKRGGRAVPVAIEDVSGELGAAGTDTDLVALDRALTKLAQHDPRKAEIVVLTYFGGLTRTEVAHVLNVSEKTVTRDWQYARLWLYRELQETGP